MMTTRVALLGLILLVMGTEPASAQTKLEIVLGGGYAVVVTEGHQSLDVGPIRKPSVFSTKYMLHRMKLAVDAGLVDQARTTVPTQRIGVGNDPAIGWDLTDFNVELWVNDAPLPKANINLPAPVGLGPDCDQSIPASNNREFLPDIPALSGSTGLVADWKRRLQGRLTLHGGALSVNKLAPGCFTFYQHAVAKGTRRLADGQKGLLYARDLPSDELTLRLTDAAGKVMGKIVLRSDAGVIKLTMNTHDSMNPMANTMIDHFKYFYELLAPVPRAAVSAQKIPNSARQIPKWLGVKVGGVTPGEACPPGFFDLP